MPEETAIFRPATSLGSLIWMPLSFFVSNATVSRRYVEKSYFSFRSSVTVTLEMKASASPESIRTKFCAQSAAWRSTFRPRTSPIRYAKSVSEPMSVLSSSA